MNKIYTQLTPAIGAVLSAFVISSLQAMIPWLIVMAALIVADLITGLSKAIKIGETISLCKMVRDTMAKSCVYFSIVTVFCMVQIAGGYGPEVPRNVCLVIIFTESSSIIRNFFRFHGYIIDLRKLFSTLVAKRLGGTKEDYEGVITKDEGDKK